MLRQPIIEIIDDDMAAVWRKLTPAQKMRTVDAMFRSARTMITCAVREAHPEWEEQRVAREVSRRISHGTC